MLAVENKSNLSLKEFCTEILTSRPEISDHMDKNSIIKIRNILVVFL